MAKKQSRPLQRLMQLRQQIPDATKARGRDLAAEQQQKSPQKDQARERQRAAAEARKQNILKHNSQPSQSVQKVAVKRDAHVQRVQKSKPDKGGRER